MRTTLSHIVAAILIVALIGGCLDQPKRDIKSAPPNASKLHIDPDSPSVVGER